MSVVWGNLVKSNCQNYQHHAYLGGGILVNGLTAYSYFHIVLEDQAFIHTWLVCLQLTLCPILVPQSSVCYIPICNDVWYGMGSGIGRESQV